MRKWDKLPEKMKNEHIFKYYKIIRKRLISRILKRIFDFLFSLLLIIILMPLMLLVMLLIKFDSKGPVIFRQTRITQYMKRFTIYKFRSMYYVSNDSSDKITVAGDNRITRIGKILRKTKIDEIPQLFNVLKGEMSFVGTRPEVIEYVEQYNEAMYATFLLPAGITSLASVKYKDEASLIEGASDVKEIYINEILPQKMHYNLKSLEKFSFFHDMYIIFITAFTLLFGKRK